MRIWSSAVVFTPRICRDCTPVRSVTSLHRVVYARFFEAVALWPQCNTVAGMAAKDYRQREGVVDGRTAAHLRRGLYGPRLSLLAPAPQGGARKHWFPGVQRGRQPLLLPAQDRARHHARLCGRPLIAAHSQEAIDFVKQKVQAAFNTHDLREVVAFLGMTIERDRAARTIKLAKLMASLLWAAMSSRPHRLAC